MAFLQVGENKQAGEAIRRAISLNDTKPTFHNNLGVALLAQGSLPDAQRAFAAAIALKPGYADALANLGLVHGRLGHTEDAARCYRDALQIQPRHVDASFNLANLLTEQGKTDAAILLYQNALAGQPSRADILNNLGRVFLDQGQVAAATDRFEKALAVDPGCAEAAFNLGKAFVLQERIQEADQAFETAARLRPAKSLWKHQRLGLCPTVFQTVAELDDYRTELGRRLDEALAHPLQVDVDELVWDGFVPSFNLAHHGRGNRQLLEKFAALFAPHIPRRDPRGSQGKRRVGFVVTAPHVNSFLRTQAGIVERLDPKRFDTVVCCTDSGMAGLRQGIRRADVTWVPFAPRFNEAADTIEATC